MPKIICTIPGAPAEIGGLSGLVKFEAREDGALVADVSEEDAAHFGSIPGYAVDAGTVSAATAEEEAERQALLARADAVKLKVDTRWKMPRLRTEVEHAEKVAAESGGAK